MPKRQPHLIVDRRQFLQRLAAGITLHYQVDISCTSINRGSITIDKPKILGNL
jgi:hypothetical protein